jgi:hypothetical protein
MDDVSPEVESEGYTIVEKNHWICKSCFNDFKEMFKWKL